MHVFFLLTGAYQQLVLAPKEDEEQYEKLERKGSTSGKPGTPMKTDRRRSTMAEENCDYVYVYEDLANRVLPRS